MPDPQALPPVGADLTEFLAQQTTPAAAPLPAKKLALPPVGADLTHFLAGTRTPEVQVDRGFTDPTSVRVRGGDQTFQGPALGQVGRPPAVNVPDERQFVSGVKVTEPGQQAPAAPAPQLPAPSRMVGQLTQPVEPNTALADFWNPNAGREQVVKGWEAFKAQVPRNIKRSLDLADTHSPWVTPEEQNAVSDMIEGSFEVAKPAIVAGIAANPVVGATAYGVSVAAARGAHAAVIAAGGTEAAARLAANIAAVGVTGVATSKILGLGRFATEQLAARGRAARARAEAGPTVITPDENVIDTHPVRPIAGLLEADNAPPATPRPAEPTAPPEPPAPAPAAPEVVPLPPIGAEVSPPAVAPVSPVSPQATPTGPQIGDRIKALGNRDEGVVREIVTAGKAGGTGLQRLRQRARVLFTDAKTGETYEQFHDLDKVRVLPPEPAPRAAPEAPASTEPPLATGVINTPVEPGIITPAAAPAPAPVPQPPSATIEQVKEAWSTLERPPATDVGRASAVPTGQEEPFYSALNEHYGRLAERATKKSGQETGAEAQRWARIAADWQAAADAAKLHQQNAVPKTAPTPTASAAPVAPAAPELPPVGAEVTQPTAVAPKKKGQPPLAGTALELHDMVTTAGFAVKPVDGGFTAKGEQRTLTVRWQGDGTAKITAQHDTHLKSRDGTKLKKLVAAFNDGEELRNNWQTIGSGVRAHIHSVSTPELREVHDFIAKQPPQLTYRERVGRELAQRERLAELQRREALLDELTPATIGTAHESPAETPAGHVAPGGAPERPEPTVAGLQPKKKRRDRGGERERILAERAAAERGGLDDLVAAAQAGGFEGDPLALRAELADRLQLVKDLDQEFADSGRNPEALLQAIVKYGGISLKAETGFKGEIKRLHEFQDNFGTRAKPKTAFGYVRGVRGVFNPDGKSLDDMVTSLRQEARFQHITDIHALLEEFEVAATALEPGRAIERLKEGLGAEWWTRLGHATNLAPAPEEPPELAGEEEGDVSFAEPDTDVLETGEVQPRLPEAGAVREKDVATPEMEAPFSLSGGADTTPKEHEADLFARDLEELRNPDEPSFSRQLELMQLGANAPKGLLESAHAQDAILKRTYDGMATTRVAGRDAPVAVLDAGARLTTAERTALLANPSVQRAVAAALEVLDDVLGDLLGHGWQAGVERTGIVLDNRTYGVFVPKPGARSPSKRATILLNPFELLIGGGGSPAAAASLTYITAVHEALHWDHPLDGPAFEEHLQRQLNELGAAYAAEATGRMMRAYGDVDHPGEYDRGLRDVLPVYSASRRRRATAPDTLSTSGRRAERPPNESGAEGQPPADLRSRGDRTVTRAELDALADKRGTTPDEEAARAVAAGYHIEGEEPGTTLYASVIPGAAEFAEQDVIPALKDAATTFANAGAQVRQIFTPANIGAGRQAAGALGAALAREEQANQKMEDAGHAFQTQFDRLLGQPGGEDKATDWWDAVQLGKPTDILPELKPAYDYMRRALDELRTEVQRYGKLEHFNAFYFPQIWKFPKEDEQWVRKKIAGLLGRRPFEGKKGFLKQRTYPTFREGLDALLPRGVKPISYNPVDHFFVKMREMRRWVMAHEFIEDARTMGIWKAYGGTFGKMPDDWRRIDGPLGTIYGPPTVAFQEAFDPELLEGLEKFATSLGVKLARKVNLPGNAWGLAYGDKAITTKAAGPETVLMHEIGHILDERYGLWDRIVKPAGRETHTITRGKRKGQVVTRTKPQDRARVKIRATIKAELRALADMRFEGKPVTEHFKKYVREQPEQMANVVHAYLWNPERTKEVAPNAYWALFNTIKENSELAALQTLQKTRSLKLQSRQHQIDIGGFPEVGFYAMPSDAARIFNNHLSRGLAGNSAIYDSYRWLNNSMVTGQLVASGLFHATFTGMNALFSSGGLALQEIVSGIEQKKPKVIAQGAKRAASTLSLGAAGAGVGFALGGPAGLLWAAGYPMVAMKWAKGWRGKRKWLTEDPAGRFVNNDVRQMIEGGHRPSWDRSYDNGSFHHAMRALRSGNWPGALARAVPAMLDAVSSPVMRWWVPVTKNAAFLDAAAFELERLAREVANVERTEQALAGIPRAGKRRKALKPEQQQMIRELERERLDNLAVIRDALRRVQTNMDNRFGEVVYANWFWESWLKNIAHVLLRSPGWQAGTYKGVIGGTFEQGRRLASRLPGGTGGKGAGGTGTRESTLAGDFAWLLAMVGMMMLINGLTTYLSTGERPKDKDWLYPRGPEGHRLSPASYLRTVASAYRHPLNTVAGITAPLNAALYRIFVSNQSFSGEIIREPGDPWTRQVRNVLKSLAAEGYQPFVLQNFERGSGGLAPIMGITNAPAEVERSEAENYLRSVMPPSPPRTHDEQVKLEGRRALRTAIENRDSEAAKQAVKEGALSRRSRIVALRNEQRGTFVTLFETATLPQAIRAYELSTEDERAAVRPFLARKWHRLYPGIPPDQKPGVRDAFNAAVKLPFTHAAKAAAGGQ